LIVRMGVPNQPLVVRRGVGAPLIRAAAVRPI